jgi:hypothetical protein
MCTIATGGVIPCGADTAVMVEQTDVIDRVGAPAITRPRGMRKHRTVVVAKK